MRAARRASAIVVTMLAAAIAGCGGHAPAPATTPAAPPTQPAKVPGHACSPSDYYMQCAAPGSGVTTHPPPAFSVASYGIDFAWSCPSGRALGARFGASYLSPDGSKNWSRACVNAYHAQGLTTVAVYESTAARALGGYSAGVADARSAAAQAAYLGEPTTRPIYFAVDFDSSANPTAILPYFRGADAVLGRGRVGAGYGGLATIRVLFANHLVSYGWQTAAWSGGVWDPRAQIQQYSFGASLDWDRATTADYGQWPYVAPRPKPKPRPIAYTYWQACSQLDAITWWKHHHGGVSSAQHRQAVAIRKRLKRARVGCSAQPHSYPFGGAARRSALVQP